jgi:CubicO group peptidase (beta-lactamase class C family)
MICPGEIARASSVPIAAGGLRAFFDREIPEQLASLHVAGAVVAVVEGDVTVFSKGYGFADIKNHTEIRPEATLFRIGSITKLFTWTAVMQLVEQGKLDLDANVNDYLDFRIPDTYAQPITLRHLMAHTAGFEDRVLGMQAPSPQDILPDGRWLASHIPARVRTPGEMSSYSNYGAALAGFIVERVSGVPYGKYIGEKISKPLGMDHTSVDEPLPADLAEGMSNGYLYTGGAFQEQDFEYLVPPSAGGAASTAADMARFMVAHLQNGRFGDARILQESTAIRMHSRLFGNDPRLNGWAYGFYEMSRNGLRVIGHGGDTRFFHSLLAIVPEKNIGLFVAYNSENAMDVQPLLLDDFLDEFFPAPAPNPAKLTLSAPDVSRFAGSYRQNRRFSYTTVEKALTLFEPITVQSAGDGALLVSSAMFGTYRFLPVEPLLFVQEGNPQNILTFRKDSNGEITYAFLNDDPTTVFEKLPWYADFTLQYAILGGNVLFFLCTLLVAPVRWLIRRIGKRTNSLCRSAVIGQWIFIALSAVGILFPVGFVFAAGGIPYGQVDFLSVVLALPVFFIALTLAAIYFNYRAWREKYWRVAERIYYTLVTLAAVGYVGCLNYWNLVGWKY